jgi:CubicO group peptidase (beta-lactamase class C family)
MFVMPTRDPASEQKWPEKIANEAEALALIDGRVRQEAEADRFSGVVLIAKGDTVLYQKACGLADRNFDAPNRIDTKFHLGSMNKMFTAIALGQLAEAGKLTFDDPLTKVLPDYPNREVAQKITLRHLLTHTSGLGDIFDSPKYDRRKQYPSMKAMLPIFADAPLAFEPGKGTQYSNAGFIVLGAVIEQVTGLSYFDYIREHVYKPAGMIDSDSYRTDEVVPNLAVGYAHFGDDPFGIAPRRPNHLFLGWRGNSCGGGYATAPDLLKFSRALTAHKLLSPQMTETVTGVKRSNESGDGYGFGFQVAKRNGKDIRGHSGGGPASGINSDLEIFWDGGYTVVVLGNYDAPAAQDLNASICDLLAKLP